MLCVTMQDGRDTLVDTGEFIRVITRPEPGCEDVVTAYRDRLNGYRFTKRTIKPEPTTEDAGRVLVFGEQHLD
jgi:hypothetical protein